MRPRTLSVVLSSEERQMIKGLRKTLTTEQGKKRCDIILAADEGTGKPKLTFLQISQALNVSNTTVITTIEDFCEGGITGALTVNRNPNSNIGSLKIDGRIEAQIIAKACSTPPEGYCRWTLSLLEKELALVLEEPVSKSSINRVLNGNEIRPHLNEYWCIPPKENGDFVAIMEEILDIYELPYNPSFPLWCVDEKPYQLLGEAREPLPMRQGDITKYDSDYVRNGTVSIFCFIQPHTGEIHQFVRETRTAIDWAETMEWLLCQRTSGIDKVLLVCDNLNTHKIGSFYKAFPPEKARNLARKVEIHYTPPHGSWLDIAEIGINIMTRECLNRRIPGIEALTKELNAWELAYNSDPTPIKWQFRTLNARIKLKHLYPDIQKARKARDERIEQKHKAIETQEDKQDS